MTKTCFNYTTKTEYLHSSYHGKNVSKRIRAAYVNLVIGIILRAVKDYRRGDESAASFLLSGYCEWLLDTAGIAADRWYPVRDRVLAGYSRN